MFKRFIQALTVSFIFFITFVHGAIERRCAIDVGSGATKVMIADVNDETNQLETIYVETSFPVHYQAALDKSADGTFDTETEKKGREVFQKIQKLTEEHQVDKTIAVATSAFRKANNAKAFVDSVQDQLGLQIQIISQREEGEIAFFSAAAEGKFPKEDMVVWDIGSGSLQMTTQNLQESLTVYMGEQMGAVAFKSYIIDAIQDKDISQIPSPNPMNEEDLKSADSYARAFARKAYPIIKQKIQGKAPVIGIGRLFYHSVRPLAAEEDVITRDGLRSYIRASLNKTDAELDNPYAYVDVSNCILTLAVMKALHIQEIFPLETTSTRGILTTPGFW